MPGFLDKMKSGAERAAFEADRLRRLTAAKSALRHLESQLEAEVAAMGKVALELHDAGRLTQPELLESCVGIEALRQKIEAQTAEVERIQEERPPTDSGTEPERPSGGEVAAPEAVAAPGTETGSAGERVCVQCHSPLLAGARFCQECGAPAAD